MKCVLGLIALTFLAACENPPTRETALVQEQTFVEGTEKTNAVCTIRFVRDSTPEVVHVEQLFGRHDIARDIHTCSVLRKGDRIHILVWPEATKVDWDNV